eukprot:COSAG02_NODE_345_length_24135_cov_6.425404_18_plen_343_part_00
MIAIELNMLEATVSVHLDIFACLFLHAHATAARFDRRNVRRIGEEPAVAQLATSSFQTTTHNPYDSDSLSSDDSEYEAQLIRRAERNKRREQEEKDRIVAEEIAAAAAATTAQEQAYPHELDADNVQQVAGMFAPEEEDERGVAKTDKEAQGDLVQVEGADPEQAQDTDEQHDATTRMGAPDVAGTTDVEEGKYLHDVEADASAAMQQMREELEVLESQRIEREHSLADGTEWVDPSVDGRQLEVEMASAKQRDTEVRVQTVAEFAPLQMGDLGFSAGEVLVVTDMSTPWWIGYRDGQPEQKGTFPSNYVKHYTSGKVGGARSGNGWQDTMMIELPSSTVGP